MRVLYIVNSTNLTGGATKSFLTLLEGLMDKGVTPHVVTPNKNDLYTVLQDRGIPVIALNYRQGVYPNFGSLKDKILFFPRLIGRRMLEYMAIHGIVSYCRQNGIQMIHTNVSVVSCGVSAAKILKIPHVLHVREYADIDFGLYYYPSKSVFYKRIQSANGYTICITRGIQHYHHLESDRSRVIYNGISVNESSLSDSSFDKDPYFLFAGRIEPSKGVFQVIEAFNQYCKESKERIVKLKIAGEILDESYYDRICFYVKNKGIQNRIIFMGVQKNLNALMQGALAMIVASPFEAFGRCMPEAMLNHCLTMGRNTAGTKEQYDNGLAICEKEIGIRYNTTQELAYYLGRVVASPDSIEYTEMKENAYRVVRQLYSKKNYVDSVFTFYQEIMMK